MSKIAVFFPGIGYHCDKPLMYYGRALVCELGYDEYKNVVYSYTGDNIRGDAQKIEAVSRHLLLQAEKQLAHMDWSQWEEIVFISKSIGTVVASAYANQHGLKNVKHVFYTPLELTFTHAPQNSCGFIGTADPWSDVEKVLAYAQQQDIPMYVYENANHSLETGNCVESIKILKDVLEKTRDWLRM